MRIRALPCIACTAAALALGLAAARFAAAQDERPTTQVGLPGADDELQRQMVELFGQVERKLRRVDVLLAEAGSGRPRKLAEVSESGIDRLLQESLSTGRSSVQDIDRLLELAQRMAQQQQQQSSCSSCQSGSCDKPGHGGQPKDSSQSPSQGSPLDRGEQSARRENTPEGPSGEGREPSSPEQNGQEPSSPLGAKDQDPRNQEAGDPPALATGETARGPQANERWGDLPVHVQDMFRTEGDRHVPARYRDWIDSYYRRLAARAPRR